MTKLRYLIAGLFATLIQGVALSYSPENKPMNVAFNEGASTMQIQLLTIAASQPKQERQKTAKPLQSESDKTPQSDTRSETSSNVEQVNKEPAVKEVVKPKVPTQSLAQQPTQSLKTEKKRSTNTTPSPVKPSPKTALPSKKPVPTKVDETKVIEKKQTVPKVEKVENVEPANKVEETPLAQAPTEKPDTKANISQQVEDTPTVPKLMSQPKFNAKPVPVSYPKMARKKGFEGRTLVEVWVNQEGKQIKQTIIESSGHAILDQRALNTIKKWQFSRRLEQGQAIAHRVHIPINFKLK